MSLINSILGQKVILLLVGGILLIFLIAVALNFIVAMRAAAKRRAKRRAAEEARALAAKKARARAKAAQVPAREARRQGLPEPVQAAAGTLADELGEAAQLVVTDDAQATVGAELTPPSVTMAGPTANAAAAPQILPTMQPQALGAPIAEAPKKDAEKKDDKEKNEIQSMLADVFEDEESNERFELLLGDSEAIPADDLLAQMNKIAQQLNTKNAPKDASGPDNRKESRAS